jgi:hypothetical protein
MYPGTEGVAGIVPLDTLFENFDSEQISISGRDGN